MEDEVLSKTIFILLIVIFLCIAFAGAIADLLG